MVKKAHYSIKNLNCLPTIPFLTLINGYNHFKIRYASVMHRGWIIVRSGDNYHLAVYEYIWITTLFVFLRKRVTYFLKKKKKEFLFSNSIRSAIRMRAS